MSYFIPAIVGILGLGAGFGSAFYIAFPAQPPVSIVCELPKPPAPPANFTDLKPSQRAGKWNQ